MRNYKSGIVCLLIISIIAIGVMLAISPNNQPAITASAQERKKAQSLDDISALRPIDAAPEEADARKNLARKSKNKRYNLPDSSFDLSKQADGEASGRVLESELPPPFPIGASNLIIIGNITKRQPYLSDNKTAIYTEFNIQVEEVLQNNAVAPVSSNETVVADREGGAIRMANGRVLRYLVTGVGAMPEKGKRYLLFLKADAAAGEDYVIICGYELKAGKVIPLEDISDRAPYINMPEAQFLSVIKEAIAKSDKPSKGGAF
jgi:hypothetical protein